MLFVYYLCYNPAMQLTKIEVDPALWDQTVQQLLERKISRKEAAVQLGMKYNTMQARLKRRGVTQHLERRHGSQGDDHHFSLAKTNPARKAEVDAAVNACLQSKRSMMSIWKKHYRDLLDYSALAMRVRKAREAQYNQPFPPSPFESEEKQQNHELNGQHNP